MVFILLNDFFFFTVLGPRDVDQNENFSADTFRHDEKIRVTTFLTMVSQSVIFYTAYP